MGYEGRHEQSLTMDNVSRLIEASRSLQVIAIRCEDEKLRTPPDFCARVDGLRQELEKLVRDAVNFAVPES